MVRTSWLVNSILLAQSVALFIILAGCAGRSTPSLSQGPTGAGPAETSGVTEERGGAGTNSQSAADLLKRGAQLYNTYCLACHGGDSGGQMMDMPPRHNANGHTWHHPDCQLVDTVLNGSGEMGEMMRRMMGVPETVPRMPAFKRQLMQDEVRAILAHIKTWWTEEQRQAQARLTQTQCR